MTEPGEDLDDLDDLDDMLEAVVLGDLDRKGEPVRARTRRDPAFARDLERLTSVQSSLDDIGELVRGGGEAADATGASEPPGLDRARRLLRELRAGDTPGPQPAHPRPIAPHRRPVPWPILGSLAAAALVLVLWRPWAPAPDDSAGPTVVLGSGLVDLQPRGTARSIEAFTWRMPAATLFDVEVRDPATGELLDFAVELEETVWTPAAARGGAWPEGWPDTIQWQVTANDASNSFLDSASESVTRSPD